MTIKKPLVASNGEITQLPITDTVIGKDVAFVLNSAGESIGLGQPVAVIIGSNNEVSLGKADDFNTMLVFGLVFDDAILDADSGYVQTAGMLTATSERWQAITVYNTGLIAGLTFYLDPDNAGMLTYVPPTTSGQFVCPVGIAKSETEFLIRVLDWTYLP